jgi:glutamyl-tRNA synthetase
VSAYEARDITAPPGTGAGRFAPSPSGDLHLGNLRTALLSWLAARHSRRGFIIRIEDLDRQRDQAAAQQQLADLASLGLDWDEPVTVQTEEADAHEAALAHLKSEGFVYECTCSRKDILNAATAPHAPPGAYPGTCRNRTDAERARARNAIAPRRPALRLRSAKPGERRVFVDRVLGAVEGVIDDFVLQRGDGTIAYNLAVVVDDANAGVDQVVRGDDLAASTSRQILLQDLLGYEHPEYAHVPLVLGSSGKRLAKRDGAVTLQRLAEAGITPAQVLVRLSESVGLHPDTELINHDTKKGAEQLVSQFDFARLPDHPWVYQPATFSTL